MKRQKSRSFRVWSFMAVFSVVVLTTNSAHAGAWGEPVLASLLLHQLQNIDKMIEGVLLGQLKSVAVTMLNNRVANLVGGSSTGTSLIISDWRNYLYTEPDEKVDLAMNDYYTTTLRSKSSGFSTSYGSSSYESYLENLTRSYLSGNAADSRTTATTLSEATADPVTALQNGDLRAFAALNESGSNPYGYMLQAQGYQMGVREQAQTAAQVKAMASGYKGVEDQNGNTILPSSTISLMVADSQNIGNNIIASAQNPEELISGVVTSLVNRTISNLVQNGVGQVQANLQRQVIGENSRVSNQLGVVKDTLGAGAAYSTNVRQQTSVNPVSAGSGAAAPKISQ